MRLLIALGTISVFIGVPAMPFEPDHLIRINRNQTSPEKDSFATEKYRQFAQYLPKTAQRISDIGGGVGAKGRELKRHDPASYLWVDEPTWIKRGQELNAK